MSQINVDVIQSQSSGPVTINDNLIVTGTNNIRPYKVYSALLSQSGTNAPTAIILENEIGLITFNYATTGNYQIVSNFFVTDKTAVFLNNIDYANGAGFGTIYNGGTTIFLNSRSGSGTLTNGLLFKTFIEIRVYP
jgi:hypothetical protein